MLKKLIGVAVVAALFACSDDGGDDNKPGTSSGGGEPGTSSPSSVVTCEMVNRNRLVNMTDGKAATWIDANGKIAYAYVFSKPEYTEPQVGVTAMQNKYDNCYCPQGGNLSTCPDTKVCGLNGRCRGNDGTGGVNGAKVDDNVCFWLDRYNLEVDAETSVGIGVDVDATKGLGNSTKFAYKFKGPEHEFRLAVNGEDGIFWMYVVDASEDEWATVEIDISEMSGAGEGLEGLDPEDFDPTKIENIQWVPAPIEPQGTLYVSSLYGCE